MNSLRRWLYRPKRSDSSLLAQFYFADEDLNLVASELDSFEGRKDPERCTALVNQLRACQARVLNVVSQMMDEQVKDFRASRDFRVKFPDDVIQENLAGQLWFGAECLAAGSSIMNREVESACMRPLARALTKNLDSLRNILREQCLRSIHDYTETIKESLIIFDKLFAEFELSYVSAMVPVKTAHEYDLVQEITVLFSETVQRALKIGLLTRDMIDEYDPALMFTIPRLAIVSGVHIFKDGPLNPDNDPWNLSDMFRPFQTLLLKIRELLGILTEEELNTLERALCSQEEPSFLISLDENKKHNAKDDRRKHRESRKYKSSTDKKKVDKEESDDGSMENELTAQEIAERLEALALNFETSRISKLAQSNKDLNQETRDISSESSSSSSSSSSLQSEVDTEEGNVVEVEKDNENEHADSDHVLHFTSQLYSEANLDSRCLTLSVPVSDPNSALTPEFVNQLVHISTNEAAENFASDTGDLTFSNSQDHSNIDASGEAAAAGRSHFAMNKCDSNDSGLHSEVLSNSDSTFTISSSDSNHHMQISDIPASLECHNHVDNQAARNNQSSTVEEKPSVIDTTKKNDSDSKSTDSDPKSTDSDLKPSDSKVKDHFNQVCLNSPSDDKEYDLGPISNNEAGVASEQHHESTTKQPSISSSKETIQPAPTQCVDSTLSNLCYETSPLQAQSFECCDENLTQAPPVDSVHVCRVNGPEGATSVIVKENGPKFSHGFDKGGFVAQEPLPSSSNGFYTKSISGHSKRNHNIADNLYDNGVECVNGIDSIDALVYIASEDVGLNCASLDTDTSWSPQNHISVPSSSVNQDKENNNVHKSAIKNNCINFSGCQDREERVESEVLLTDTQNGLEEALQLSSSMQATSDSMPVISHMPSVSTANIKAPSPLSSKTSSDSSSSLPTTTDRTQNSGRLASNSPAHSSQNELLHNASTTTTTSNPPPTSSAPATSSIKNKNNKNIKGSSKTRNFKRGPKIKKQSQGTSSSHGHIAGLPDQAKALMESQLLDSECNHSSETSSYNSDCGDQEEIDLAIKAAENATRQQVRARFQSNSDMIHRLFVCISGVADQLQTNFAGDLRNILRAVFDMNCSEPNDISTEDKCKETTPLEAAYRAMSHASRTARRARYSSNQKPEPPSWVPDEQSNECMSCQVPFTFVRRRHHCRNCGKIFCSRCSSNFVPLPHFGQDKAVRVCNRCYMFQVTPFTVRPTPSSQ